MRFQLHGPRDGACYRRVDLTTPGASQER
jgi:hypothetical protein